MGRLIAEDPPPAFPEWMKRHFPALRAEETNALFQAFRRRRLLYRPGWRARLRSRLHPGTLGLLIPVLVCAIALPLLAMLTSIGTGAAETGIAGTLSCLLAIGVGVATVHLRNARRKQGGDSYLPERVGEVFGVGGYRAQAAVDIWMCGFTGRDVAEAIFLENFERSWRTIPWLIAGFFGPPVAVIILLARDRMDAASWTVLVSLAAAVGSMWWALLAQLHDHQGTRELERRYAFWRSRSALEGALSEFGRQLGEGLPRMALTGLVAVALGALMALPVLYTHAGNPRGPRPGIGGFFDSHQGSVMFHLLLWWLTLLFASVRLIWGRWVQARLARAIADAEHPFAVLMASVVCGDPDGEAWARWRHGHRPLVAPLPAP